MSNMNRPNQNIANALTTNEGSRPVSTFIKYKIKNQIESGEYLVRETESKKEYVVDSYNKQLTDPDISGTIVAGQAGNQGSMIMEVGNYSPSNHNVARVVDPNGLAPTVMENHGTVTAVTEKIKIGAIRGREDKKQHLEIKDEQTTNTITSVQKDNVILEPKVIAGIGDKKSNKGTQWYEQDRIYESQIATSVATSGHPNYAVPIKNATKDGYLLAEDGDGIDVSSRMETHRGTVQKGMCQTLKTQADVGVLEMNGEQYAIRKLTPKECMRLMGFDDEDYEKQSKVVSSAQIYKQAGNGIVVNVLEAIFGQLYEDD